MSLIYYHILSSDHAISNLEKERIKVGLIKELNDPFELLPYLRYDPYDKREPYYKARRAVSKEYGLLCFSKEWGDPVLWGHYGERHKGIALGFEVIRDDVINVQYVDKNTERPRIELAENREENKKAFLTLAGIKYESWSYEKEARILVKLDECIREANYFFLPFSERLRVKEIVLGRSFDKRKYEKINQLAGHLDAKVILTRLNWAKYRVSKDTGKTTKFESGQY